MKHFTSMLLAFVLLFSVSFAQDSDRFRFGVWLEPHLSSPSDFIVEHRHTPTGGFETEEFPKFAFDAGLTAELDIARKLALRLGLVYSDRGYQTRMIEFGVSSVVEPMVTNYQFSYMSLPISLRLTPNYGRVRYFVSAGIVPELFVYASESPFIDTFRTGGLSFQLSAGAEFQLSTDFNLLIEPVVRRAITVYSIDRAYKPISAGVAVSLVKM